MYRKLTLEDFETKQKDILGIIQNPLLTHEQKVTELSRAAENLLTVLDEPEGIEKYMRCEDDERCICNLYEGDAPYRPRYICPDYPVFLKNGSRFLDLPAPKKDIWEVLNSLLILYHNVPSITNYPVFIGNLDELLEPYIEGTSDEEVKKAFIGKTECVEKLMTAILAGGHVLVEDVPGVGKTTLALAFAKAMNVVQNRVQFTPDVLPADITGFTVYNREKDGFFYRPGAVMCNILLADEINRTSPKTQAALLEVMEEAEKANRVFYPRQNREWDEDFLIIRKIYEEELLGKTFEIRCRIMGARGIPGDWRSKREFGGGMLYDWGVHLLDQVCWMFPGVKLKSVFADIRNVINTEVDDYFQIMLKFDNDVTATVELGTYYLADKVQDKWFERHWFVAGDKGTAYVDGFFPEGKIVRTTSLLTNVGGKRTMTAAGPTRSFGPAPEGRIATEPLPEVHTEHRNYFENYVKAYHGEEEFLVQIPEIRRVLKLMDAVRESGRTGKSIDFE